ncbi:MAG: hypothetical protein OSJ51_11925 [Parabacteroides distasonis]|nr:hypothetical protein [Parabacteroides distasonis]
MVQSPSTGGLYLEDQDGKVMFEANLWRRDSRSCRYWKGSSSHDGTLVRFLLQSTETHAQSPLNLQFVIDAFASKVR